MKYIDFHTHIYPEALAEKATKSICDFYDLKTNLVGKSEVLLELGRKAGIEKFLVLPVAVKASHAHHINEFIASEAALHDEFYGFGTVHAETENFLSEMEYIEKAGLKGIKLHPDTQRFNIDDERLFPLFEILQEKKLPILFHCGDFRYDFSHPRRLLRVSRAFPELTIIGAHLGGWSVFEEAFSLLKDTNCFFDISSTFDFLPLQRVQNYVEGYTSERILFGSDFPLGDPGKEKERFLTLKLTEKERENIAFKNAERILKIK